MSRTDGNPDDPKQSNGAGEGHQANEGRERMLSSRMSSTDGNPDGPKQSSATGERQQENEGLERRMLFLRVSSTKRNPDGPSQSSATGERQQENECLRMSSTEGNPDGLNQSSAAGEGQQTNEGLEKMLSLRRSSMNSSTEGNSDGANQSSAAGETNQAKEGLERMPSLRKSSMSTSSEGNADAANQSRAAGEGNRAKEDLESMPSFSVSSMTCSVVALPEGASPSSASGEENQMKGELEGMLTFKKLSSISSSTEGVPGYGVPSNAAGGGDQLKGELERQLAFKKSSMSSSTDGIPGSGDPSNGAGAGNQLKGELERMLAFKKNPMSSNTEGVPGYGDPSILPGEENQLKGELERMLAFKKSSMCSITEGVPGYGDPSFLPGEENQLKGELERMLAFKKSSMTSNTKAVPGYGDPSIPPGEENQLKGELERMLAFKKSSMSSSTEGVPGYGDPSNASGEENQLKRELERMLAFKKSSMSSNTEGVPGYGDPSNAPGGGDQQKGELERMLAFKKSSMGSITEGVRDTAGSSSPAGETSHLNGELERMLASKKSSMSNSTGAVLDGGLPSKGDLDRLLAFKKSSIFDAADPIPPGGERNLHKGGAEFRGKISGEMILSPVENISQKRDLERVFRDKFLEEMILGADKLSMDIPSLESFMVHTEDHPCCVWQNLLLSCAFCASDAETELGLEIKSRFDCLVDSFPDVLQRVLLRDSYWSQFEGECDGDTALHIAVKCGQTKVVGLLTNFEYSRCLVLKSLIESAKREDGFRAIQRAVLWSCLEELQDDEDGGTVTAFMKKFNEARKPENIHQLRLLISTAWINRKDIRDPWHIILLWASASGQFHIVREFKKIQPEFFQGMLLDFIRADEGKFVELLKSAIVGGPEQEGMVKREEIANLVTRVIMSNLDSKDDVSSRNRLLLHSLHGRTAEGWTALHLAAASGDDEIVDLLIDSYNKIPEWKSYLDMDRSDLPWRNVGFKSNMLWKNRPFSDSFWMTPLHYAVLGNHERVVMRLVSWKTYLPHVNDSDIFMRTAFHMACSKPCTSSTLEMLVNCAAVDVNAVDCCSFTPLHWAAHEGVTATVKLLVSKAGDRTMRTTQKDIEERNPYEIAVIRESTISSEASSDIQNLLLTLPAVKNEMDLRYQDRAVYVNAAMAILIGAVVIASMTFGGWLEPPLGQYQESTYNQVQVFWAFNSVSFFFSMATVMATTCALSPAAGKYIGEEIQSIQRWVSFASFLLIFSVLFVIAAFAAAGFASLSPNTGLTESMTITTGIGSALCITIALLFLRRVCRLKRNAIRNLGAQSLARLSRWVGYKVRDTRTSTPAGVTRQFDGLQINTIEDLNFVWDFIRKRVDIPRTSMEGESSTERDHQWRGSWVVCRGERIDIPEALKKGEIPEKRDWQASNFVHGGSEPKPSCRSSAVNSGVLLFSKISKEVNIFQGNIGSHSNMAAQESQHRVTGSGSLKTSTEISSLTMNRDHKLKVGHEYVDMWNNIGRRWVFSRRNERQTQLQATLRFINASLKLP